MSANARYREVRELFHQLADVPEAERDAWLAARTSDPEVVKEVQALLAELVDTAQLDPSLHGAPAADDVAVDVPGYRLLETVGQGGMGRVWRASRLDADFEQTVAIKLMSGHALLDDQATRRFRRERQILADLEHPNITRLIDGGTAGNGLPFLAMEYVEGRRIDDYCPGRPLSEVLRLFVDVCGAVQYAHQKLIVHRDLKPANILVTADGMPKLMDFGVARLVDEAGDDVTKAPLTPRYASPEQVRDGSVSVAGDIYSLGVILYELLTGRSPYQLDSGSAYEVGRAVVETIPLPPSQLATPELRRRIRGDLDAIAMKALRKAPHERYATAGDLAADLHCHLENRPVAARRGGTRYRIARFVRRHRWAVAATFALAATIVAFGVSMRVQLDRVTAERDKAQTVTRLLAELFESADPYAASPPTVTEVLGAGTERVLSELAHQPDVQAELLHALAQVHSNLGEYERALELASLEVDRRRTLMDRGALAEALYIQSVAQGNVGDQAAQRETALEAARLYDQLPGRWREAAMARLQVGFSELYLGELEQAHDTLQDVLSELQRRDAQPVDIAEARNGLALAMMDLNRWEEAEQLLAAALPVFEAANGTVNEVTISTRNNLALTSKHLGDFPRALAHMGRVVDDMRTLASGEHPMLGIMLSNLASLQIDLDRLDEAMANAEEALVNFERKNPDDLRGHAIVRGKIGLIAYRGGDLERADAELSQAVALMRRSEGAERRLGVLLQQHADVMTAEGRLAEATHALDEARTLIEGAAGKAGAEWVNWLRSHARLLSAQGDSTAARRAMSEALTLAESVYPPSHPEWGRLETESGTLKVER